MSDSTEFLVKTNNEVDEWMDGFYTDGRKADFRLHCQWAWQEQERRKVALIEALQNMLAAFDNPILRRKLDSDFNSEAIESARAAIAKTRGGK